MEEARTTGIEDVEPSANIEVDNTAGPHREMEYFRFLNILEWLLQTERQTERETETDSDRETDRLFDSSL